MKIHIENMNITLSHHQPPAGLLAALAITNASRPTPKEGVPAIGEKWPGLDAVYVGTALSQNEDRLVHLILWPSYEKEGMDYEKAVKWAESVNPDMNSHIPTRHQSITLFERVRDQIDTDYWYWTPTKTAGGNAAFGQYFVSGSQDNCNLSWEGRVRAVSEIPL